MAELANLETTLAGVMGMAMAAQGATEKVTGLAEEGAPELVGKTSADAQRGSRDRAAVHENR